MKYRRILGYLYVFHRKLSFPKSLILLHSRGWLPLHPASGALSICSSIKSHQNYIWELTIKFKRYSSFPSHGWYLSLIYFQSVSIPSQNMGSSISVYLNTPAFQQCSQTFEDLSYMNNLPNIATFGIFFQNLELWLM